VGALVSSPARCAVSVSEPVVSAETTRIQIPPGWAKKNDETHFDKWILTILYSWAKNMV